MQLSSGVAQAEPIVLYSESDNWLAPACSVLSVLLLALLLATVLGFVLRIRARSTNTALRGVVYASALFVSTCSILAWLGIRAGREQPCPVIRGTVTNVSAPREGQVLFMVGGSEVYVSTYQCCGYERLVDVATRPRDGETAEVERCGGDIRKVVVFRDGQAGR